jgi:amylosucrase
MKDCCQVTAPGVLFIAEAIVAPAEIAKYFGEDAINAKECEIAYNATYMSLLWDAVATKNAKLLNRGVASLPTKLERATWLNYIRCHDDIGLGFDDNDARMSGYDPFPHRRFLVEYFTGNFSGSPARGLPFGDNPETGDARISGALASLVGLEAALDNGDERLVDEAINVILLLHGMILSFGGIPLLYYGDAIGTCNSLEYLADPHKANDARWINRSRFDWEKAARRHHSGTVEQRIFSSLKKLIGLRKQTAAFADFDNRQLVSVDNPNLFVFFRTDLYNPRSRVLVIANFNGKAQNLGLDRLRALGFFQKTMMRDLCSGSRVEAVNEALLIPPYLFYWLVD